MNKRERKKQREKIKHAKHGMRLSLPANKRHKTKRDYKRKNKVKVNEIEKE